MCGDDGCEGSCGDCDDELECTVDSCAEGQCKFETKADACLMGGVCVAKDELDAGNPCLACNPAESQVEWTALPDGLPCDETGHYCVDGGCCDPLLEILSKTHVGQLQAEEFWLDLDTGSVLQSEFPWEFEPPEGADFKISCCNSKSLFHLGDGVSYADLTGTAFDLLLTASSIAGAEFSGDSPGQCNQSMTAETVYFVYSDEGLLYKVGLAEELSICHLSFSWARVQRLGFGSLQAETQWLDLDTGQVLESEEPFEMEPPEGADFGVTCCNNKSLLQLGDGAVYADVTGIPYGLVSESDASPSAFTSDSPGQCNQSVTSDTAYLVYSDEGRLFKLGNFVELEICNPTFEWADLRGGRTYLQSEIQWLDLDTDGVLESEEPWEWEPPEGADFKIGCCNNKALFHMADGVEYADVTGTPFELVQAGALVDAQFTDQNPGQCNQGFSSDSVYAVVSGEGSIFKVGGVLLENKCSQNVDWAYLNAHIDVLGAETQWLDLDTGEVLESEEPWEWEPPEGSDFKISCCSNQSLLHMADDVSYLDLSGTPLDEIDDCSLVDAQFIDKNPGQCSQSMETGTVYVLKSDQGRYYKVAYSAEAQICNPELVWAPMAGPEACCCGLACEGE